MAKNNALHVHNRNTVALLKACAKQKDLLAGAELHAKVAKSGLLNRDMWIANAVIDMYSKCGALAQAHTVLEKLPTRDVVAWTSLIAGYAGRGLAEEALKCFETMQHEGIKPDGVIVCCLLRACGSLKAINKVEEIHNVCERLGLLGTDVIVGTMLVDIYATCDLLSKAKQVFDKLLWKDVITWTVLIAGYSEHGYSKEAMRCFEQMQHEGASPDAVTFTCSLKACSKLRVVDKIQQLHVQIDGSGFLKKDNVVGTVLVDAYAKCGAMDKSLEVFKTLKHQDVVSWTVLIEGYAEHGYGEEVFKCLEQMKMECVLPNAITITCSLKACGSIGSSRQGRKIHCQILRRGELKNNRIVGNALVDMYIKCGLLVKAHQEFDKLSIRDAVAWTSLIAGYAEHGHGEMALGCFEQMQHEKVSPNSVTYMFCLKACASLRDACKGEELHAQIEYEGLLEGDVILGNALVDMYAASGMFSKAQEVFDKLSNQSVVLWTSLIARFAQYGYAEKAIDCFKRMQHKGVRPNDVTLVTVLKVCGRIAAIDEVQDLHAEIERRGLFKQDLLGNVLVFTYSKCGLFALAHEVFDKLHCQDVVSWNSLIAGYIQLGDTENALSVYNQMQDQGFRPGSVTFTSILSACNRQGLVFKSQAYFYSMSKDFGIASAPEHLCSMLDIFCRSGQFEMAISLIDASAKESNVVMLHSFLGACKNYQNVELGRWAFDRSRHSNEKRAAPYLSTMEVQGLEAKIQDRGGIEDTLLK